MNRDPHASAAADPAHAETELPTPLASLVGEVVRRTRLRRSEREEIAAELVAHFRDGLASGRSTEELALAFGDPKASARQLRHGAIAKRSVLDRGLRRTLQIVGLGTAAVVLGYAALAIHVARLRPTISFDPIATYQALLPATDDPAWPTYLEALAWAQSEARLGTAGNPFDSREHRDLFVDALDRYAANEPGASTVVTTNFIGEAIEPIDLAAILAAHADELALLRKAAAMPVLGRRANASPSQAIAAEQAYFGTRSTGPEQDAGFADMLIGVLLPHLAEFRHASRLLVGDARLAEEQGDFARAAANLAAIFGIARHAEENRTLIGQLVAAATRVTACRAIVAMLERSGAAFDDDSLRELAGAVASVPEASLRLDMASERLMFEDVVQRMYSDDGEGDGVFIPWAFADFAPLITGTPRGSDENLAPIALAVGPLAYLAPSRRETIEQHRRWMSAIEEDGHRPWWDGRRTVDRVEQEVLFPDGGSRSLAGGNLLLGLLLPAVSKAGDNLAAQRFELDGAAIAIALARFHRARGEWPDSLEALVPEFLPTLPLDPETALPYRYELLAAGPMVWSTGPDGIDDGGTWFRRTQGLSPDADRAAPQCRFPTSTSRSPTVRTAVLRHQKRTGSWPASLDTLSADDRAGVPPRGFTSVEYALEGDDPIVRRTADADAPFTRHPAPGEAPQGDRILVEWGLGTFAELPAGDRGA